MTFVGDVIIKVTFKVSFLYLYVLGLLEAWPDEIVLKDNLQKTTELSKKQISQPCILTLSYPSRRLS